MPYELNARDLLDMSVPISRFNKGEAGKIFDEVNSCGIKVVIKNNKPAGVILSPDKYLEVMKTVESYHLLVEAMSRAASHQPPGPSLPTAKS
jgi:antitoxin StbD